jgi:hypothetical protein
MDIVNTSFFNSKNEEFKEKDADKDKDTKNGSKSNKDYNDIILEQLKNYNKLRESSDTIKSHNSFL